MSWENLSETKQFKEKELYEAETFENFTYTEYILIENRGWL